MLVYLNLPQVGHKWELFIPGNPLRSRSFHDNHVESREREQIKCTATQLNNITDTT